MKLATICAGKVEAASSRSKVEAASSRSKVETASSRFDKRQDDASTFLRQDARIFS